MEIWAGIECTINRVGENYFDQQVFQGRYKRGINDLLLATGLGIRKIRYPILWERHKPLEKTSTDWAATEKELNYLVNKNVEVIAGLVHHGSGPRYVNLKQPLFAAGLAGYATEVANRFPFINYYTPINEPLTTARFCGLYGLWHPHNRDDNSFLKILLNECKATIMAMEAIKKINPSAKLVHTEDIGKIHSTALLQYQADFENERRWLSIDLIAGRVDDSHPLWSYIKRSGIDMKELSFFLEHAIQPDILGFNYYATSERYLDEEVNGYPERLLGGNSTHAYVDVEAVRVDHVKLDGPQTLLREAWNRYKLPLAITEAHINCGREDQLRWLNYIWNSALSLKAEGADIRGVTAWSLFGTFGWDQLLTKPNGNYESGVYDLRSPVPRATALTKMIKSLAQNKQYDHPLIKLTGWWQNENRIMYPARYLPSETEVENTCAPVLIIGSTGSLGQAFARVCKERNIYAVAFNRKELDLVNIYQIKEAIEQYKPWAIINAAGFVRVDDAEIEHISCYLSNAYGPVNLAKLCAEYGVKLLTFSTDLVFNGKNSSGYIENDVVDPLNVYGSSKAEAEQRVLEINPQALVVRTSSFFSAWDNYNFASQTINTLNIAKQLRVAADVIMSPTYVPDLVNTALDLLIDDECGIWHLANDGMLSWFDFAKEIAYRASHNTRLIIPVSVKELGYQAKRPLFSALHSTKGKFMPPLNHALDRFFAEMNILTAVY